MMSTPSEVEAIRTVERTQNALNNRGWCVWSCSNLDNDNIFVVKSEFNLQHLPHDKYPVYTVKELQAYDSQIVKENGG
jgi:hypothetical protein